MAKLSGRPRVYAARLRYHHVRKKQGLRAECNWRNFCRACTAQSVYPVMSASGPKTESAPLFLATETDPKISDRRETFWLSWFLEQVEAAAHSSESIVRGVLEKARFWMRHSQTELNERQLKALNRMLDSGEEGFVGGMTNRKYANLTKASSATAQRDLSDLVAKGCLVLVGSGRSAHYELAAVDA